MGARLLHELAALGHHVLVARRRKDKPNRQIVLLDGLDTQLLRLALEKRLRQLDEDSRPVAGRGVGIQRSPVRQARPRLQREMPVALDPAVREGGMERDAPGGIVRAVFRIVGRLTPEECAVMDIPQASILRIAGGALEWIGGPAVPV